MNRNLLLFLFLFFNVGLLSAQVQLSRQVIGTLGGSVSLPQQIEVSFTSGESVVQTIEGSNNVLTQGFQQPGALIPLSFDLELTPTSCVNASDGSAEVMNIFGCFPPYSIEWSNGATGNIAYDLAPGLYSVRVYTSACSLTQEFEIIQGSEDACEIHFLNAFSPNDDGINDTWIIENVDGLSFRENHVEIYNRWGQMIWSADYYDNNSVVWDGKTEDGVQLTSGTYFYLATVNEILYKGYIELTR